MGEGNLAPAAMPTQQRTKGTKMAPQDMDIIAARDLKVGDVILDGMHKPYVESRVVLIAKTPDPMARIVNLDPMVENMSTIRRTYKIDDYVSIAPRVTNEAVAA